MNNIKLYYKLVSSSNNYFKLKLSKDERVYAPKILFTDEEANAIKESIIFIPNVEVSFDRNSKGTIYTISIEVSNTMTTLLELIEFTSNANLTDI